LQFEIIVIRLKGRKVRGIFIMDNRYPIGQFDCPNEVQEKDIQMWIKEMTTNLVV
jgi:hypothetical protein